MPPVSHKKADCCPFRGRWRWRWWRREWGRFAQAVRYFTRLPCPGAGRYRPVRVPRMLPYFPWVGLVVGAMSAGTFWVTYRLFADAALAALAALTVGFYVTGAFHEDGLADSVDGFGGGYDTMRILAIMKDSRIGTFGAVALWIALTAQWQAMVLLAERLGTAAVAATLCALHPLARFCVLVPMGRLPYLRHAEAASKAYPFAAPQLAHGEWGKALLALAPLLFLPTAVAGAALAGALVGVGYWWQRAAARLGGYTGDLLGAMVTTAFTLGLLGIVVAWNSI